MESGFIYLWYDRKHKRYYLGKHWGPEDDGYICSSAWMKQAHKRRPQDFRERRILERIYTNHKDLANAERRWGLLIKDEELGKRYYNLRRPGEDGHWADNPDESVRRTIGQKISAANTGSKRTEETKQRMSEAMKGFRHTEETKKQLSEHFMGKRQSQETIQKRQKTLTGRPKPVVQCPHCFTSGGKSAMIRWHFDACKMKE